MRNNHTTDKHAAQVPEGPRQEAWFKEEIKFEIERLKAILRDPQASVEEKAIAQSQVNNYRELSAGATASGWLQQMYLLGDLGEGEPAQPALHLKRSA